MLLYTFNWILFTYIFKKKTSFRVSQQVLITKIVRLQPHEKVVWRKVPRGVCAMVLHSLSWASWRRFDNHCTVYPPQWRRCPYHIVGKLHIISHCAPALMLTSLQSAELLEHNAKGINAENSLFPLLAKGSGPIQLSVLYLLTYRI